ncbi:MAG: DUF2383 domain-containing protein [Jejuia sp.]
MTQNKEKISKLNQLLVLNANAERAYLDALDATADEELQKFFRARAFERNEFCRYLGAEIRIMGGTPNFYDEEIDTKINWPNLKKVLGANNPKSLFAEINSLKSLCVSQYNKVISGAEFTKPITDLLEKQKQSIGSSISLLRYKDNWSSTPKFASNG